MKSLARILVLLAPSLAACSRPAREAPWNVLLVTLDTTRADYLGPYGRPGQTPNLERLAARGTRFDLAIASAAVTPVAHAAILTGRDNPGHGLRVLYSDGGYRLPDDVPTLATVLKGHGYHTGAVHGSFPVSDFFGFGRGFDHFDDVEANFYPVGESGAQRSWNLNRFQRRSDEVSDRALRFLAGVEEPFLLWLHYWDPHDPAKLPPKEFTSPHDPDEPSGERAIYAREVSYMDGEIGRVVDELARRGSLDRTLVVVVADHGQGLGDHDWSGHRVLYQEQIRVPLLIVVPGRTSEPRVEGLVRTIDILPTLLDYLGFEAPAPMTGRSLRALMEGGPEEERVAFADQINLFDLNSLILDKRPLDGLVYVAMDREWKLLYRPLHPEASELYALGRDPHELENLLDREPAQVLRLKRLLAEQAPWVLEPFQGSGDGAERAGALQALAALGYGGEEGRPDAPVPWSWICPDPEHPERSDTSEPCARCGGARIPVVRAR